MSFPPLAASSPPRIPSSLDLGVLPPMFILPTHLADGELQRLEDWLTENGALLTYNVAEAKLVLGRVGTKRRAELELRSRQLWTEEVTLPPSSPKNFRSEPPRKRRKTAGVEGDSTTDDEDRTFESHGETTHTQTPFPIDDFLNNITVVKLAWLEDSKGLGKLLPLKNYITYQGKPIDRSTRASVSPSLQQSPVNKLPHLAPELQSRQPEKPRTTQDILERAKSDAPSSPGRRQGLTHYSSVNRGQHRFGGRSFASTNKTADHHSPNKVALLQQTTSEYEGVGSDIPEPPEWVKKRVKYACERSTTANPANGSFIEELKKIRLARLLSGDEIGVRAYSTSIASIAAYRFPFSTAREILALPGCDTKIANLWVEWKNNDGKIKAVEEAEEDEDMRVLRLFYDIWGVGATTARGFLCDKGWRDLDDIVEYGWSALSRVQQIGVKYYDEFLTKIPRPEVEFIAAKVREHAVKVRYEGVEVVVVGGYRRGNAEAGDVDVIVSHRDLAATANIITDIVASLETEQWITHTLLLSLKGTERGQSTLPFRAAGGGGHGFDTLDKALVVWQDPVWPTQKKDLATNPKAKNPNIHRRVDIIASPWRTVGCAITGWSGGTTFQRDLRRYAKNVKGWKFDSSGVRDRYTGEVVELEGPRGVEGTWEDAERAVFKGMGLVYREPWERCTA
ncbi:uncharacterized protein K452DRAFT_267205 [Aplosporella prunicola CBS 121167]|uniref:DNA polymerase n=1 Tax=Aplosporella prunicola CBS 121167 TaxID=1176127 RepID=A0A6A6BLD1_9PEZI|nr:uncharacterized protein K452DRAFT_267205 [Aplosporella prunicola CBS 121167]KAF2144074.1 hypothetical protein K452DRAFT_267205 [Aplosporella prunicola CBS 121167]